MNHGKILAATSVRLNTDMRVMYGRKAGKKYSLIHIKKFNSLMQHYFKLYLQKLEKVTDRNQIFIICNYIDPTRSHPVCDDPFRM